MKLRLFYEGRLLSASGDPSQGRDDRLADHKHAIRKCFHEQLKYFWHRDKFLSKHYARGELFSEPRLEAFSLLHEVVERNMPSLRGFSFVPLVCHNFDIWCKIDLLLLRRDKPGGIFQSRDLDNRLKVIFDALKMPRDAGELGSATPTDDEQPMYVLLQEDSLITHVSIETDDLLDPPTHAGKDDSYVRLLVTVTLGPITTNMFNLSFV